ncbi:MAG: hypothetical protein A2958_00210 [Candidatus Levybacteria bacterium RIFCSPLOWO2_01_FULL_38_13]|nr:MAG: hypothetical protein A2629_02295 [Candidatus Levybacteria bacterium RIFCSPHIGHO2_01_FULL_41_15]OGH34962.1 MAG: hypothetical protein A2958_00210 [Candidatus Levybacteria bacterium RIFCSPLOWO2_01_FULL_38_13]
MKKLISVLFLMFLINYLVPSKALAEDISFGVYPPIIKIRAKSSSKVSAAIKIKNFSGREISLQVVLRPFEDAKTQDGQFKFILYKDYTNELANFLSKIRIVEKDQSVSELIIGPEQEKNLNLIIDIGKLSEHRDYYFSAVFLTHNNHSSSNSFTRIIQGVGSNILVSMGDGQQNLQIEDFTVPFTQTKKTLDFSFILTNSSDRFSTIKPYILVKNIFGKQIERIDFSQTNILAKSSRNFTAKEAEFINTKGGEFLLGPYTTTLILNNEEKILTKNANFVSLPLKHVLILTLILIFLIFTTARIKSRVF